MTGDRALVRVKQEHDHHRVTFVELFYDLVFVFAVTQLSHSLIEHFSDPPEEPAGLRTGARAALEHLDVVHLVRSAVQETGWLVTDADGNDPSAWRGAILLGAWAVAAVTSLRRHRALLSLHLIVGSAFVRALAQEEDRAAGLEALRAVVGELAAGVRSVSR